MAGLAVLCKGDTLDKHHQVIVSSEDLQSPQRSITDFFKSPPSKQKVKNLTHFFSSTPKYKEIDVKKSNVSIDVQLESFVEKQDTNLKKCKKSKKSLDKNKIDNTTCTDENTQNKDNNIQNSNFQVPVKIDKSIIKRVKFKKKKKSKKNEELDEQFLQHFDSIHVKSDTSTEDINISLNNTPQTNNDDHEQSIDCKVLSVKHKSKKTKKSGENLEKNAMLCTQEKTTVSTNVKRKRDNISGISEFQSKRSKLTTKHPAYLQQSVESNEKKAECSSISYEDYLKGLDDHELKIIPDLPTKTKYSRNSSKTEETRILAKDSNVHSPEPQINQPVGVFDLFTKKTQDKSKCEKANILFPNLSCISTEADEIILISSEINENKKDKTEHAPDPPDYKDTSVEIISSPSNGKLQKTISKEGAAFLKSDKKVEVPSKTGQAVLSFTKNGLKTDQFVSKSVPVIPVLEESLVEDLSKKRKQKSRKSKSKKVDKACDASNGDTSPIPDEEVLTLQKAERRKYRVTSLQFDDCKKTPIKMKIKNSICDTNGEESDFTPRSKKKSAKKDSAKKLLVKAQEILVKANQQKTKNKEKLRKKIAKTPEISKVIARRLSPRLATKPNISLEEVIDLDEEEDDDVEVVYEKIHKKNVTKKSHTSTKNGTPKKTVISKKVCTPNKAVTSKKICTPKKIGTPKKGTQKTASIFNKKKIESVEFETLKLAEDPEKVRLRQAFLSSCMPDELKKQAASIIPVSVSSEYTPFPVVNHTQQLHDTNYLQKSNKLNIELKTPLCFTNCDVKWTDLQLGQLYNTSTTLSPDLFKNFKRHATLSTNTSSKLLQDIKSINTAYQFEQMFESLKNKKLDEMKSLNPDKISDIKTVDAEVITIDEDVIVKKKKLKRKKSKSIESTTDISTKTLITQPQLSSELQWTDRYQPTHSSDIIGNSANIAKLKTWLLEWKHKTHKDARKMKKLLSKQSKSSKSSSQDNGWLKEDSDFNSEDSEEEDDTLCNTMMITGQHGIGKTATVYALAQELGYKVFEVNTSSSRNGKKILSRLQEATQSHQVAQNKDGIPPPVFSNNDNSSPKTEAKNKLPAAFTNLFNKAKKPTEIKSGQSKTDETKLVRKSTENELLDLKKRKRNKEIEIDEIPSKKQKKKVDIDDHIEKMSRLYNKDDSNQAGGLNLTSTSVILFDEADLVFEKDVGFISAVQYFMNTTKIPIILTTTNKNLASLIQARLEVVKFDSPSPKITASHLQTICLVEGVRTQYGDILNLVKYYNNDVRRCMLALQFWIETGGSIQLQPAIKINHNGKFGSIDLNEGDFVSTFQHRSSTHLEDDKNDNLPLVHKLCMESVLGLTNKIQCNMETCISMFLQENFNDNNFTAAMHCCDVLRSFRFNLLYHNILYLVPLPKSCLSKYIPSVKTPVKKRNRILSSDDCDSETSNSGVSVVNEQAVEKVVTETDSKKEKRYISKCLSTFSKFFDNISLVDTIQTVSSIKDINNSVCRDDETVNSDPVLSDLISTYQHPNSWLLPQQNEVLTELETRSTKQLCDKIQNVYLSVQRKVHEDGFLDRLSIPVPKGVSRFCVKAKMTKLDSSIHDVQDNLLSTLPTFVSRRHIQLDYLPYLRTMHQHECFKKIEKAKRRFHHHFDNIGLGFKKTTLDYLEQPLE